MACDIPTGLFSLPNDILFKIYKDLNAKDITCLASTCKFSKVFKRHFYKKQLTKLNVIQYIMKRDFKKLSTISNNFTVKAYYKGYNLIFSNNFPLENLQIPQINQILLFSLLLIFHFSRLPL